LSGRELEKLVVLIAEQMGDDVAKMVWDAGPPSQAPDRRNLCGSNPIAKQCWDMALLRLKRRVVIPLSGYQSLTTASRTQPQPSHKLSQVHPPRTSTKSTKSTASTTSTTFYTTRSQFFSTNAGSQASYDTTDFLPPPYVLVDVNPPKPRFIPTSEKVDFVSSMETFEELQYTPDGEIDEKGAFPTAIPKMLEAQQTLHRYNTRSRTKIAPPPTTANSLKGLGGSALGKRSA
jgi:hypothetical protein